MVPLQTVHVVTTHKAQDKVQTKARISVEAQKSDNETRQVTAVLSVCYLPCNPDNKQSTLAVKVRRKILTTRNFGRKVPEK